MAAHLAFDHSLYDQYLDHARHGRTQAADAAVAGFVTSVRSVAESRAWVFTALPQMPRDPQGRIRHEIYVDVVFAVLFDGYRAGEARAKYWLALTHSNLLSAPGCHERIAHAGPKRLLQEALKSDGRNRAYRRALLEHLMSVFAHMDRDWPAGILSGGSPMTDGWDGLKADIALARRLDQSRIHQDRLDAFADRISAWRGRVTPHGRALARKERLLC